MSDDFTEWWTGSYGEFSRRCEWPLTMTQAVKMAWDAKQEEITALRAEVERLKQREKDLTLEGLAHIGRLEQVREILAGTDIGSLPNDYATTQMAQDRMDELERLRAALKEIESITVHSGGDIHGISAPAWQAAFNHAHIVARAALEKQP